MKPTLASKRAVSSHQFHVTLMRADIEQLRAHAARAFALHRENAPDQKTKQEELWEAGIGWLRMGPRVLCIEHCRHSATVLNWLFQELTGRIRDAPDQCPIIGYQLEQTARMLGEVAEALLFLEIDLITPTLGTVSA